MTLRLRLLISALVLSLATTVALGLLVRSSWQETERKRFEEEFERTVSALSESLTRRGHQLSSQLEPLCAHDPTIDSALIGTVSGTLDERLLSVRVRVDELRQSLGLDELALLADTGEVLAGQLGGDLPPAESKEPSFRASPPAAFAASCVKRRAGRQVTLIGASHLEPLLRETGRQAGIELALLDTPRPQRTSSHPENLTREVALPELGGAIVTATRSRRPLRLTLESLDLEVASAAALSLLGALIIAILLSRGLSQPVVAFAARTRRAVQGTVEHLPEEGGPELTQAARAFNQTLDDLRQLRLRLAATERIAARREVARQIAHEIKNPLSPIRTSVETLRKLHERGHPDFDAFFDEATTTVLTEVRRISLLVSSFSEYARLPSPVLGSVDLVALVRRYCSLHEGLGTDIEVQTHALPPIEADSNQLAQVLTNLIKNAREAVVHLPGGRVRVSVGPAPTNAEVALVQVEDNGPGVDDTMLSRLFEPYATSKESGTGLGLPISHRIAVEHGGDLTYARSDLGGALFELSLPMHPPAQLGS